MILNGNQRGNARDLALHLMKAENELVEIHEMRGFVSRDLMGAFNEVYAISRATRCDQFLYSLSLNPPPHEDVSVKDFMSAIETAEQRLGLNNQARAIVFHTKHGRKHAHVVWSRIDLVTMKAKQMSFDKEKLTTLSRELFLQHGWEMPDGLKKRGERDPLNYTHSEYQHAQRIGKNAKEIKADIRDAWVSSDCRTSLEHALSEKGYYLARGDRRGFVVMDRQGEIYSLPRYAGVKTKEVRTRLGDGADLPSVADIQRLLAERKAERPEREQSQPEQSQSERSQPEQKSFTADDALALVSRYHAAFTPRMMERTLKPVITDEGQRHTFIKDIIRSDKVSKIGILGKENVYATKEMIALEKQMLRDATEMIHTKILKPSDPHFIEYAIYTLNHKILSSTEQKSQLTSQQATVLRHMTQDRQLSLVVGVAGAGKTTLMEGAKEAWEASGFKVRGAAPSGIAASGLKDVGINASTIHSLLGRMQLAEKIMQDNHGKALSAKQYHFVTQNTLTAKDVLIVDEAGMVSSRQMAELISQTKKAGAKLILVGDPQQLQPIEAGTAFQSLLQRHDYARLTEVRRQKTGWQAQATLDFAEGKINKALDYYHKHDCIHSAKNRTDAKTLLVADRMQDFDSNPHEHQMVLAYTRKDVADLNALIKVEMVKRGKVAEISHEIDVTIIEQDEAIIQKQAFSVGDRIFFRKNDTELGVMNGTFGMIEAMEDDVFTVTLDNQKTVTFSAKDYNHLQLGYATTVHKSQGMTVDKTYVLATPHFDRHTTYVAMSRHKHDAKMYISEKDFKNTDQLCSSLGKQSDKLSTLGNIKSPAKTPEKDNLFLPDKENQSLKEPLSFRQRVTARFKTLWQKVTGGTPEPEQQLYDKNKVAHVLNGGHASHKKLEERQSLQNQNSQKMPQQPDNRLMPESFQNAQPDMRKQREEMLGRTKPDKSKSSPINNHEPYNPSHRLER